MGYVKKYLVLSCVFMSCAGCVINRPPGYDSAAVETVCSAEDGETVAVSYGVKTVRVTVDFVPSWEELYRLCGTSGGACVNMDTQEIHLLDDRRCEQHASHELGHVFAVSGTDVAHEVVRRRHELFRG